MIYLDSAATNKIDNDVLNIVMEDLKENWGNASTMYDIGQYSRRIIEASRKKIAACIGALPEEIYFTSGSSESNAWAIHQRKRTLISSFEHHDMTDNPNCTIVDRDWFHNTIAMENDIFDAIAKDSFERDYLVSHMLIQNETGEIFNIHEFADYAHRLNMPFHSDMTQGLGHIKIDMHKNFEDVDIATFGGHKCGAPKFCGFSYFNKETFPASKIRPLIYGSQEQGVRGGTENVAFIHAMALAIDKRCAMINVEQPYCKKLKLAFLDEMHKDFDQDNYMIVSPANSLNSVTCICFKNVEGEMLQTILNENNIYVGTGAACTSGDMNASAALTYMRIPAEYIRGEIRLSYTLDNTVEEMVEAAKVLKSAYKSLTSF